jgi:hypothetical protein
MKRRVLGASLVLFLCCLLSISLPGRAAAQSEDNLLRVLPVSGTIPGGGAFTGVVSIERLSLNDAQQLVMHGRLDGVATLAGGGTRQIRDFLFTTTVLLTSQGACDILTLDLGPINLDLLGLVIDLSPVELEINAVPGAGNLLGNLLCAVAGLLDGQSPLEALLAQLSSILGGQLSSIPVAGSLQDGGTFAGALTITDFALDDAGKLVVSGLLDGTATPQSGEPQELINQPFTTSAVFGSGQAQAAQLACDILNLDLGPIHLDLLGLVIDLSEVELDITAVPGAGNLLGNLLCAVAGLLDGGSLSDLLNNILALINQLLDGLLGNLTTMGGLSLPQAAGVLQGGGTFNGSLILTNLTRNANGDLLVDGILSGTATPTNGSPITIPRTPFSTLIDLNSQNGCKILTLDLGPIHLDLLGLVIDLSEVELDITAVPGEGRLLGNLLCAVASLLDGANPLAVLLTQLTDLLGNLLNGLPVSGTLQNGGAFDGTLDITSFALDQAGRLTVSGLLNGTATPLVGEPQQIVDQPFTNVVGTLTGGSILGTLGCGILNLDLGPLHLDVLGLVIDLSEVELDITAVPGAGNLLGNLLCAVAGLLDDGNSLSNLLEGLLNLINRILNGLLNQLSVSGILASDQATGAAVNADFDGTVSITRVALDDAGKLVAEGFLDGIITSGANQYRVDQEPFTAPVQRILNQNACDILTLDLGPIHLDLLGLVVDLSAVELDITALPGEGNLLGNLLCAVAGLLDPSTALQSLLDQLGGRLGDAIYRMPVSGVLQGGGTFAGTLTVDDIALDQAGKLIVSGLLNGTATPQNGAPQVINNQAFSTPASLGDSGLAQTAQLACDILSLDLGPIHLDLLGLVIDLSAVELDINAVPGAGNLLGNLLCAVAGLLDGGQVAMTAEQRSARAVAAMDDLLASANAMMYQIRPQQQLDLFMPALSKAD